MAENRCTCSERTASSCGKEAVVIDTMHVLDSCRGRDCYEDVRAYIAPTGSELINRTATVRTVEAKIVGTAISVDEVEEITGIDFYPSLDDNIENKIEADCLTDGKYDEVVYCSVSECKAEISRISKTFK